MSEKTAHSAKFREQCFNIILRFHTNTQIFSTRPVSSHSSKS